MPTTTGLCLIDEVYLDEVRGDFPTSADGDGKRREREVDDLPWRPGLTSRAATAIRPELKRANPAFWPLRDGGRLDGDPGDPGRDTVDDP